MGKTIAKKIRGMNLRTKIGIVFVLLMASFLYQGILKPLIGDTATSIYYFTLDSATVNLGTDGSTTTAQTLNGKISMKTGVYATSRRVSAATNSTAEQGMIRAYGPVYGAMQTVAAPAITIGVRDGNGSTGNIIWKAYVYDYNPAVAPGTTNAVTGAASNTTLLWTSNGLDEAHPSVQTPLDLTFVSPTPKDIPANHRIKVVITCKAANTGSAPRLYWGNSLNYSFFSVSEAPYVANSMTVNNLADYYKGQLTSVTQGDQNIPMLQFDLYSNVPTVGSSWTGGKLDKVGTNTTFWQNAEEPGDVSFTIYKDSNNDGLFEAAADTLVGGPYNFDGGNLQKTYTLLAAETITATPQRYFVVYNILRNSTYNTTVGARIADNSYFSVTAGTTNGVRNVTSTTSSLPNIQFGGTAVTKNYPADWDNGTSLAGFSETGATQPVPNATDSVCVTRNTTGSGFPLVGLINYPASSCPSVAGQGYSTTTAQADFARLYFRGSGYPSIMKNINGLSFAYRLISPAGGGTVTLRLFYVTSGGVRVNAPIASTYTVTNSITQTVTTSLAGQNFTDVPAGARLGLQIGVTANMRIGLGSANGARLSVQETAAENENVDVGNGSAIANANVYAADTNKVIDSFTLSAAKAKTVNSITVTGSALFNSQNVKKVTIYGELSLPSNLLGVLDGSDTKIGETTIISGTSATITGLNLPVTSSVKRYIVVVDIGNTPNTNVILTALISNLTVATTGILGVNSDSASGTLTILPTTTLGDFITAEPPGLTIPSNSGAKRIDAFSLKTNGGVNDTITSVKVRLATTSTTLPVGKVISDYVAKVEVFTSGGVSLGHLTAPTQDDDWQVSTLGLVATQANTEYFVEITPKGNQNITYTVKATVIDVAHSRTTNKLAKLPVDGGGDIGSATLMMDQQPPIETAMTLSALTWPYSDADGAQIKLDWSAYSDLSGSPVSYRLVRGQGNAPAPRSCTADGVKTILVYTGTNNSTINKGLGPDQLSEGVSYGYRVCAVDSVGNTSFGITKAATASIKDRCNLLPEFTINPMAANIKAGSSVALDVNIVNKDTGSCPNTTFTLSIVGTDVDDSNYTTSTFDGGITSFIIPTNNASKFTKINIAAKPGAVEKAIKTFHVKVAKSSGGEITCPDPVYVIVNKFGAMTHSSLQMGTKYGSWGLDYNCSTCHSPDSTNIKQVKNVIATPTGNRPVAFSIISTNTGADVSGVFGNDNRTGTAGTNVCEVCHHNARFHQYSASKVAWKGHNNNGDCLQCHPHSTGFKTFSALVGCDDCHGNPPTVKAELVVPTTDVLFPYASNAGSHAKHEARQVKCAACHSNGNHLLSAVPDKKINIGFKVNGSNFTGFAGNISSGTLRSLAPGNNYTYQAASHTIIEQAQNTIMTCNIYCHGWSGDGGYNSEPAWTGISQVGCGSCHAASSTDPPTSGSHHKHASSEPGFGNAIACQKCHGFRNYSTSSAHINGNVEWDLSTLTTTSGIATYTPKNKSAATSGSTGNLAPTAPVNYGTCKNMYCHSNVQSANGTAGPSVFSEPVWGGTTTCGSCHAEPNTSGGHSQHDGAGAAAFDCRICHGSGGDTNSLNHANGKIDFAFEGLGENTHYSYSSVKIPGSAAYGTCYNGNCHGRSVMTWGAATARPLCDKCHTTDNYSGGFYGTAGPNSTKLNTDPYVGAHMLHISSATTKKYSAKIRCNICHIKPSLTEGPYAAGHMDTALPAEINYGTLASSGLQGSFTSAAHAPAYNVTTKQCSNLWCHGAGMNSNEGTGPYASVVFDGGTLKAPPVAAIWNSPFLDGTGANDCSKCHGFPPPAPVDGYQHYYEDQSRPYIATECILCHNHVDSTGYKFKKPELHVDGVVNSCITCHGRPPSDEASLTVPAIGAMSYGMAGAHQAHALNPSIKKDCGVCHYNYSPEMPSYKMEIGFNAYGGRVSRGIFYGLSSLPSTDYSQKIVYFSTRTSTTVRRTNNATKINTCQNLYCHGGGTGTLAALDGGANVSPNWEGGSAEAVCGSCHGVTGATYTRSSHAVHAGTGYGKLGMDCANCHGIKENNYHVDGKVEWEFYSTAKRLNLLVTNPQYTPAAGNGTAGARGYTNNLAPSAAYGTCTVYCHSDGKGTFKPIQWGALPLNCGSCHKNQTSDWTNGPTDSHKKHSASSANGGYAIDCLICHSGSGFASSKHVNGAIDVIFNTSVVGPSGTWDSVDKTCFNILCHVSTIATGPTWNIPSTGTYVGGTYKPTCIGCHSGEVGGRTAVIPQFAGESHHIQGVAMSATYCYPCHMEANVDGTVNTTYHDLSANKTVDLVIWGAGARGAAFTKYSANGNASRKRTEYTKVNNQCISCHRTRNNTLTPFSASGDNRTPKAYSWDTYSIFSRYSGGSADVTPWGKYSDTATTMVSPKNTQSKAYSAHGRADLNQRGWNTTETWPNTANGTAKVMCFDCHNSHGTTATGIMSSYSSATGRYKGGILKSTVENVGGYAATYTPMAGGDAAAPNKNAYNPGAALCFDCHNNASASTAVPWGYNSTFGATQGISGYNDKPYFGNYSTFGPSIRYNYKKSNDTNKGGHFGASTPLGTAAMKPINGLCTPCHDPHGVSPSLGANKQYGVPLLRGTWMTSFYQEDAAPANSQEIRGGQAKSGTGDSGGNADRPQRQRVGSTPGYRIDQNTLGPQVNTNQLNYATAQAQSAPSWTFTNATRAGQTVAEFAGLCTQCHTQASLAPKAGQLVVPDAWKSTSRIHGSVKGWATTQSASDKNFNNTVHSFTCAKCHTPHNAKLPRLMVSNCLDYNHRGRLASGGTVSATASNDNASGLASIPGAGNAGAVGEKGSGKGRFPSGGEMMTNSGEQQNPGQWFFGLNTGNAFFSCHEGANGNAAAYPANQLWNTKTPW